MLPWVIFDIPDKIILFQSAIRSTHDCLHWVWQHIQLASLHINTSFQILWHTAGIKPYMESLCNIHVTWTILPVSFNLITYNSHVHLYSSFPTAKQGLHWGNCVHGQHLSCFDQFWVDSGSGVRNILSETNSTQFNSIIIYFITGKYEKVGTVLGLLAR